MGHSDFNSGIGGYQFTYGQLCIRLWLEGSVYINHERYDYLLVYECKLTRHIKFFTL